MNDQIFLVKHKLKGFSQLSFGEISANLKDKERFSEAIAWSNEALLYRYDRYKATSDVSFFLLYRTGSK